jgi:hypothetical protein
MPLVFIHGVNTRSADEDYDRTKAARQVMFDQLIAKHVRQVCPDFRVANDIYWGDLGVGFLWRLRSVPDIRLKEEQGPEIDKLRNPDLLNVVAGDGGPGIVRKQTEQPIADAAKRDPAGLVRAIFAGEADRFAPPSIPRTASSTVEQTAEAQGRNLGLLFIAVERFAREAAANPALIDGETDSEVLQKIQTGLRAEYQKVYNEAKPEATGQPAAGVEHLGRISDALNWTLNYMKETVAEAGDYAKQAALAAARDSSLALAKLARDPVTRKTLRFMGDVFVYLHHGRIEPGIYDRVKTGLLALRPNDPVKDPLVIVTHSFGSTILYDLLTSGALQELTIDLWATAGAQTSLFAEMRLFAAMPSDIPKNTDDYTLGRPRNVRKWINFYDPADALSYKHQPVFGDVTDIRVDDQANLTNAHGHYFVTTSFYEQLLSQLQEVLPVK